MIPSRKVKAPKNPKDKTYTILIYWVCGFPKVERRGYGRVDFLNVVDYCFFYYCFLSFDPFPSLVLTPIPNPNLLHHAPSTNIATFSFSSFGTIVFLGLVSST
jgi:hypothetical protein